jgi:hypothetical protein
MWWLGYYFEPPRPDDLVVSGYFVGGFARLRFSSLAVLPSKACHELLGWEPSASDPLRWMFRGTLVAKYERLHGPLNDAPHGPHFRQPLIDRWIVTESAFEQFSRVFGDMQMKTSFESHEFRVD